MILQGKTALIAGGAGAVGEGIVGAYLDAGATVLVPSRSQAKLDSLTEALAERAEDRLLTMVGHIGSIEGAEAVRAAVLDHFGHLDAVVASIGGWWQGAPLVDVDLDSWNQVLANNLTAHLIAVQHFLPLVITSAGSYTMINGGAALTPLPKSAPISIVAAGQMMMARALAKENENQPVRIHSLLLETPIISRTRPEGPTSWLTADEVGSFCVRIAAEGHPDGAVIRFRDRSQLATV
ncbi:MAG: SDR family NAD(P)-dependent oxidoreductase [Acidobacteriota bacterium]